MIALLALLAGVPAAVAAFTATTASSGNSFTAATTFDNTLQMATGGYTGNGVNGRAITIGFQPDYVIVKGNAGQIAVARTSTMPVDQSKPMTGNTALSTLRIRSFTATGFTIGTNASVNTNGATYSWVAFKARPGVLKVGSYTGNGTTQSPGTTFQPEHVSVFGAGANRAVQRFTGMTTSFGYESSTGTANAINSLDATGFTVGTAAETNTNTTTYHYAAFNEVAGNVKRGTYTGDGVNNKTIGSLGFEPGYVNIRANDTGDRPRGPPPPGGGQRHGLAVLLEPGELDQRHQGATGQRIPAGHGRHGQRQRPHLPLHRVQEHRRRLLPARRPDHHHQRRLLAR